MIMLQTPFPVTDYKTNTFLVVPVNTKNTFDLLTWERWGLMALLHMLSHLPSALWLCPFLCLDSHPWDPPVPTVPSMFRGLLLLSGSLCYCHAVVWAGRCSQLWCWFFSPGWPLLPWHLLLHVPGASLGPPPPPPHVVTVTAVWCPCLELCDHLAVNFLGCLVPAALSCPRASFCSCVFTWVMAALGHLLHDTGVTT